ncbi:E3 ubiquitin/ISG15 ligase TRIM25-like [Hoplias malabaricus]|uniref:E3 ubiquitin/ISG15 ligase TRIM25-like n=1 Tax=Hoplias malabaricus TaxID=27720 RepID=UPI003461CD08
MAEANISVDEQQLCCSVCLELLTDPVTVPCGHSYCLECIKEYWDQGGGQGGCFCPQCRRSFAVRPELNRNTVLADLVEKFRETLHDKSRTFSGSGSEGVFCDVCSGEKQSAVSSCLICLVSYCSLHIQPHFESPAFRKHKLVPVLRRLQDRICPRHDRLYEFFCRSDQKCLCCLCTLDEHKNHDTVPAETARAEKVELLMNWNKMMNERIQQEEKLHQCLTKAIKNIKSSAQSACDEIEDMFTQLLVSIENMRVEVIEQLKAQEENEVRGAEGVLQQVEMEIDNLRKKSGKLEEILQTGDNIDFLQNALSFTCPPGNKPFACSRPNPKVTFERVVHSISILKENLEDICNKEMSNISEEIVADAQIFPRKKPSRIETPKPKAPLNPISDPATREDFLHYSCYLTLEPRPNHPNLRVCSDNRAVDWVTNDSSENKWPQVLCREGLTGRCYWEAEWNGSGVCTVGLCEGGQRGGQSLAVGFGRDRLSWGLECFQLSYVFRHGREKITMPTPKSTTRVGVFLDHRAGTVSFYSVSGTMTLLHRVRCNFAQPLYPGFALWPYGGQRSIHPYFFNGNLTSCVGPMSIKLINL